MKELVVSKPFGRNSFLIHPWKKNLFSQARSRRLLTKELDFEIADIELTLQIHSVFRLRFVRLAYLAYSLLLIGPLKLGILFSGVVPIYKEKY